MIGYLGLARETFDVPFAMSKFLEGKKVLRNIFTEIKGIDYLITNNELSDKAFKYFKDNNFKKIIIFQTTFTDAKFLLHFARKINKPLCIIAFPEPRTGKRLRLNSVC